VRAGSDDSSRLPEAQVCEINGVSQQYRQTLVRRKLLRHAPASGCTIRDALELAAVKALSEVLPAGDVPPAANQLIAQLGDIIPGERIDAVYDRQYKRLQLVRDDASLREMVLHGRPVSVIPLADRLAEVGDAFRRIAGLGVAGRRQGPRQRKRGAA
jgi:hypothetical protein